MFVFSIGKAQEKRESFSDLDAKSYQLYLDKNWTAVIETVEKAFDCGFDTYYLRLRQAYAYFYTQNYRAASHQYREALLFDPNDKGTAEMLVISLKYAGCTNEASLAAMRKYQLDESGTISSKAFSVVLI